MSTPAPLAVSIRTAADMLDLSEWTIREAVSRGQLPARKVGRVLRIEVADLTEWFRSLESA